MSAQNLILERRQFGRRKVATQGFIELPLRPPLPCRVIDISPNGVQLDASGLSALPSKFTLVVKNTRYECHVRHRENGIVGAVFTGLHPGT